MHILDATEVTNSKNRVDTANANSSQILKMNPLFFITQDCLNQRKTLFYLRSCSATIFHSMIKAQVSILAKLV